MEATRDETEQEQVVEGSDGYSDKDEAVITSEDYSEAENDEDMDLMDIEDLLSTDDEQHRIHYACLESLKDLKPSEASIGAIRQRRDDIILSIDMLVATAKSKTQIRKDQAKRHSERPRECMCDIPGHECNEVIVVSDEE